MPPEHTGDQPGAPTQAIGQDGGGLRITAVIPAWNAAGFVDKAVRSMREQLAPPDEVIVVDDGSDDDTAGVAARAGARVIRRSNGGPAAARNTGIRATSSEWIALLDADDVSSVHRLERQRPCLGDPRVAVVFGARSPRAPAPPATLNFAMLWERNPIPTSTVLLRRAAWESVGGFDEAPALIGVEDYNLWLRLTLARWQFRAVPESLVEYRPTPASLTMQTLPFAAAELENVRRIARLLPLAPEAVRAKEYRIYRTYGLELFHRRDWANARAFLAEAAGRYRLTWPTRARLLAATVMGRRGSA